MILHTGRFQLRPLCAADAEWIAREIANPAAHSWLTNPPHPYSLADADWYIRALAENPLLRLIKEAGQPLGVISIESTRRDTSDLGYWLAKQAWARGVMTKIAVALIEFFFDTGAPVVGSGWIRGNVASKNVLTKLGFTPTDDVLMCHANFLGKEVPVERVRLTKEHWQRRKPA